MELATSHRHTLVNLSGTSTARVHLVHAYLPGWAVVLAYLAILGLLLAGVTVMARATRGMSRPGRIVVGLVAMWTIGVSIVVFLDAYRPTGDWRGGSVEVALVVLYGLVAAGVVWTVDRTARRIRTSSSS